MSNKVLVIDDAGFDRTILVALLNQTKFEVVGEAKNGKEGLKLAMELKPDIITLDKLMPDLNGLEVLKELRASNIDSKVVMISGDELESIKEECANLNVHCFLNKPVSRTQLIENLSKL